MPFRLGSVLALFCLSLNALAQSTNTLRAFGASRGGLTAQQLAVVINENDPQSIEVGEYYAAARQVPSAQVLRVHLPLGKAKLSPQEFEDLRSELDAKLTPEVQALVLVWTTPYAVECNSITGALALGLDTGLCAKSCAPSKLSPYFDASSLRPYDDFGMRIAMLLPIESSAQAKALIDRGVAADHTRPQASAYLLTTSDAARSSRARYFPPSARINRPALTIRNMKTDTLENAHDVMFYITGRIYVDKLDTLTFLPGALADHLTSFGGNLLGSDQMSSLRWLDAGATASYGTVSEPCSHPQKFPYASVLMRHYLQGESAIEAYWKSVAWPTQGLFIGEPLAAPYR
jgi:uncharacterized protein (TIGR03790 family)